MKLTELIEICFQFSSEKEKAINYSKNIDNELPKELTDFIFKIKDKELINQEEFSRFSQHLATCNTKTQDCITHLLYKLSFDIYNEFKDEIDGAVNSIETNIKAGNDIPKYSEKDAKKYIGLLNCHHFFASYPPPINRYQHPTYPEVKTEIKNSIHYNLPFAINALRLVGKLPISVDFNGFNLSKPYYPLNLNVSKKDKALLRKGIKKSDEYYPYRMIAKIAKGDTGDNTFKATNGKKMLFIRGKKYDENEPKAIFASKIASLVSPKHFPSERLLDNYLAGSKALPGYVLSVADDATLKDRKRFIEEESRIFPGSGIIDEVTNFVDEEDVNIENYGFSSRDIHQSYLTKIDFDQCDILNKKSKESYERDILTRLSIGIYQGAKHIQGDSEYIKEKLFARLKLSMLTEPLINKLADKSFISNDVETKEQATKECVNRTNIALELFFEHPKANTFLAENPLVLDQCYQEIKKYIETHFEKAVQEPLQRSLKERVAMIKNEVHKKLGLDFNASNHIIKQKTPIKEFTLENFSNCSTNNEVEKKYTKFCREIDADRKVSISIQQQAKNQLANIKNLKLAELRESNSKILEEIKKLTESWKELFNKKNTSQEVNQAFQEAHENLINLTHINKISKINLPSRSLEEFKISKAYTETLKELNSYKEKRIKEIVEQNRTSQDVTNKIAKEIAERRIRNITNLGAQCPDFNNSFSVTQCDNEEVSYMENLNTMVQPQTNKNNQDMTIYQEIRKRIEENKSNRIEMIKSGNEKIIGDLQPKLEIFHEKILSISKQNQRYAETANILWASLENAQIDFAKAELTSAEFRDKCLEAINIAKPVLQEHRGFLDQLLNKIFEAFGFNHYSRFRPTDSLVKANELSEEIIQHTTPNRN